MKRRIQTTDRSYRDAFYCLLGMAYLTQAVAEEQRRIAAEQAQRLAQQQRPAQLKEQLVALDLKAFKEMFVLIEAKRTDPQNDTSTDPV